MVELNRAVAVGMALGPEAGLELVDALAAAGELDDYHLLHSVRADRLEDRVVANYLRQVPGLIEQGKEPVL